MEKLTNAIKVWVGRFRDAFSACSLVMVQGDASALTLNHIYVATETGFIAAVGATIVFIYNKEYVDNKYVLAGVTGLCTAIADLAAHPSHIGNWSTEAIVTGIGAGLLTLSFAQIKQKNK